MANDVTVNISGRDEPLRVVGFSVRQDATPIAPGDSSGSVGTISITARGITDGPPAQRTAGLVDRTLTLNDNRSIDGEDPIGHGLVSGKVTSTRTTGELVTMTADSPLARFNTDRDVPPFFGAKRSAPLVTARDNLAQNPSFTTTAAGGSYFLIAGTGSGARVASGGSDGGAYYRMTWSSAGSVMIGSSISSAQAFVVPSVSYTASLSTMMAKSGAVNQGTPVAIARIEMSFFSVTDDFISTISSTAFSLTQLDWLRASVTGVAPAGASYMLTSIYITSTGTSTVGDVLAIDQVLVEQSSVLNPYFDGNSDNAFWTGVVNLSPSSLRIYGPPPSPNYDATIGNAFRYYCGLVGIPETQVVVDKTFEGTPVAYPAWSGNVWVKIKEFCTAIGAEVIADADLVYLRDIRRYEVKPESLGPVSVSVDGEANAQFQDIYNQNNRWVNDGLAWVSTSSYSLNTGETQYQTIELPHSLTSINSPVPAQSTPAEVDYSGGTGLYVIRDSDDKSINPTWWTNSGGSISAALVEGTYDQVVLTLKAPTRGDAAYKPPYSIGDTGGVDRPGIFITGSGVFVDKKVVRIPTGASAEQTSTISASTIDNIFISDAITAHDRGSLSAGYAGGPVVRFDADMPLNTPVVQKGTTTGVVSFGTIAGSRIKVANHIYRIDSAVPGMASIAISGVADMTFDDLTELYSLSFDEANLLYAGMTFTVFNALWSSGLTFNGFDALQPSATFDTINTIFEGMDFNQHSVTPHIEEVVPYDTESNQ